MTEPIFRQSYFHARPRGEIARHRGSIAAILITAVASRSGVLAKPSLRPFTGGVKRLRIPPAQLAAALIRLFPHVPQAPLVVQ
jgi:hypothetical protein